MLLAVNLIRHPPTADLFDGAMRRSADRAGLSARVLRPGAIADPAMPGTFTHLILSGSEASALRVQAWEAPLAGLVRVWVRSGRPLLGICYGHQFLAKVLLGPGHVRRSRSPEVGFQRIQWDRHPLFEGQGDPEVFTFHQDEVHDLPAEMPILASSDACAIQAVQYGAGPAFGVQFHPEFTAEEARAILSWFPGSGTQPPASDRTGPAGAVPNGGPGRLIDAFLRMGRTPG